MYRAYDVILETEVNAREAAHNFGYEHYRYECAYCGEEVSLCAVDSKYQIPHFRHKQGNNDTECENFLGTLGALRDGTSRRSKKDVIEIYFNSTTKLFYLGTKYPESQLTVHQNNNSKLCIATTEYAKAFSETSINRQHFAPDTIEKIIIQQYSQNYYVWNSLDNRRCPFKCFKNTEPTFFKVLGNDTANFNAKLIKDDCLYVGIKYLAVFTNRYSNAHQSLPIGISAESPFTFNTMGKDFLAAVITVDEINSAVEFHCKYYWNCRIDMPETVQPLWPPISNVDDVFVSNKKDIIVRTSFTMQAHANINVHSRAITEIGSNIYKIALEPRAKIHRKNADFLLRAEVAKPENYEPLAMKTEEAEHFECPAEGKCFVFGTRGAKRLSAGQKIIVYKNTLIKGNRSNYTLKAIFSKAQEFTAEELLGKLLRHYKVTEPYAAGDIIAIPQSEAAKEYLNRCVSCGTINTAVKRHIHGGRL